jgi:hypothetical protein
MGLAIARVARRSLGLGPELKVPLQSEGLLDRLGPALDAKGLKNAPQMASEAPI